MLIIERKKPKKKPMQGYFELYSNGQTVNFKKNYLIILPKYRAPFEKPSIGDLNICFRNIYLFVWKLSSKVKKAKNLKNPFISEKPKENRKTKKVINP